MSILEDIRLAKVHLEEQHRISLRALKREFQLDDDTLDELVEELVVVQRVATREGEILAWMGRAEAPTRPELRLAAARGEDPSSLLHQAQQQFDSVGATGHVKRLERELARR